MRQTAQPEETVTVIVPCYNHARYVERCLAAIDAQAHDALEVIVIDDGSKDESWERIQAFRWSPERRVRTIRTRNQGAHSALNLGLQLATGRWVSLCNSDDLFTENRVPVLLEAVRRANARFAFSAVSCIDDASRDITDAWPYAADLRRKQEEIASFPSVGFALLLTNVAISTGNFFFERSLTEEVGFFRPYKLCHDWDFILRALLVTEPVYVPQRLYQYRLHRENSFTSLMGEVAARECPELMRRYLKAAHRPPAPQNPKAPCPANWPVYFDWFIEEHRYAAYMTGWNEVDEPEYRPASPPASELTFAAARG